MYRSMLACCVLMLAAWPAAAQESGKKGRAEPPAAGGEKSDIITIRGEQFRPYSADRLRGYGYEVPDLPRERNAAFVYVDAINASVDVPKDLQEAFDAATSGNWPEGEPGQRLAGWLEQNQKAIDLTHRAAAIPDYYFPPLVKAGDEDPPLVAVLLPSLSNQRQLGRILAVHATYLRTQGQADEALNDLLVAQRMGNQISHGNTLIEGLVGIAIGGLADKAVAQLADSGEASPEALKAAVAEMDRLTASLPNWEEMISREQIFGQSFIDDAIDMPGGLSMLQMGMINGPPQYEETGWTRLSRRLKRLYLPDRVMKKQLKAHYAALASAGKPREDGTIVPIEEDKLFANIPMWNIPVRMIAPSLGRANELTLRSHSNFQRAKLALAVAAYKAEQGTPPPTLSSLAPKYVASIPIDPVTGSDFDYTVESGDRPAVKGLEQIGKDNEGEILKKRRAAAILNPRASRWRRYVQSVCERYQFTDAQRASAEAVLRDMEARALRYEQAEGAKLKELVDADKPSEELNKKLGPLDKMFNELKQRLEALTTADQRRAAAQQQAEPKAPPPTGKKN